MSSNSPDLFATLYALYDAVLGPSAASQSADELAEWMATSPSNGAEDESRKASAGVIATTASLAAGLRPHLVLASRIREEMQELRARKQMLADCLHRIGIAVFLVSRERQLTFVNAAAKAMTKDGGPLSISGDTLVAEQAETELELQAAITRAVKRDEFSHADGSVLIKRTAGCPLAATVLSLTPEDSRVPIGRARAKAMILVNDPDRQIERGVEAVARMYKLTSSEARLLARLAGGDRLGPAAERLSIGITTARTHLQHIFLKTHTKGQSDLMRLIAALAPQISGSPKE